MDSKHLDSSTRKKQCVFAGEDSKWGRKIHSAENSRIVISSEFEIIEIIRYLKLLPEVPYENKKCEVLYSTKPEKPVWFHGKTKWFKGLFLSLL